MAFLDRTQSHYWTAALYKRVPGRGLIFQGYLPYSYSPWPQFVDRVMALGRDIQVRSFYWDSNAGKWVVDVDQVIGGDPDTSGAGVSIGAIERRNPLPVGRYWQDIFSKQEPAWLEWFSTNTQSGSVKVEKAERFFADPLRDGSWLPESLKPESAGTIADRTWFLFQVLKPVDWPAVKLGFPTIADQTVHSSADTADNPPGPSPSQEVGQVLTDYVVKPAAGLLVLYLGAKLLLSRR